MRQHFVVRTNERSANRQLKWDLKLATEFLGREFRALSPTCKNSTWSVRVIEGKAKRCWNSGPSNQSIRI